MLPLQLLDVQPPQHPRREQPLEQSADPTRPCQRVSKCTRQPAPSGVTAQFVTIEERASDSVSTRPGSGSSTRIRKSRAPPSDGRPEAVDRAGTHPALLDPELGERRRQEVAVVPSKSAMQR
jgi:hypothetical protein